MSAGSFFDTNVLVYTDDKSAPAKQRFALDLVSRAPPAGTGVVSVQVLQEFFVTVTRKLRVDARTPRALVWGRADSARGQRDGLRRAIF